MIKLAYVIDVLDTNLAGTENQLIRMINGLDRSRFDVTLVCLRPHEWLEKNAAMLNCAKKVIDIRHFRKISTYRNIARLMDYFRSTQPHVVHTFFPVSNIVGVIAARLAGVPGIVSSRRDYGEWMSRRYLYLTRLANRFASRVVANSQSVKSLTLYKERIDADKVDVILNGIDILPFSRQQSDLALKQRLGIPESHRVIGIVGNFRPMKRHDTFVRAAAEILKNREDVHFLLVGGTPSTVPRMKMMEDLGRSLGIAANLHFVGVQKDVKSYLSIMDIGVNCSEQEGLSNAIMEYMANGVPAIVSRSGGNPDLISDGIEGLTFDLGDQFSLAKSVLRLLNDESLRHQFISAAREKIKAQMSNEAMLNQYASLYTQIAGAQLQTA